jgi:putative transposase
MGFAFIAKHRGIWPVAWMCGALGVLRSGFHAWLTRSPSQRARDDEVIGARVRASHVSSYRTYGARRVSKCCNDRLNPPCIPVSSSSD